MIKSKGILGALRRALWPVLSDYEPEDPWGIFKRATDRHGHGVALIIPIENSGWISVDEALPIDHNQVEVYEDVQVIVTDGTTVDFGSFQAGAGGSHKGAIPWSGFSRYTGYIKPEDVTHWMAMPKPPVK